MCLILVGQVNKLEMLFPTANVTKMVSRTPGILYLDVDRTIKPKALWIKGAVGLDQDGLDSLIETGELAPLCLRLSSTTGLLLASVSVLFILGTLML